MDLEKKYKRLEKKYNRLAYKNNRATNFIYKRLDHLSTCIDNDFGLNISPEDMRKLNTGIRSEMYVLREVLIKIIR